ncbi:hypothetical protein [Salininema proteolyticum]|uniref:Secreted protein n=1 Tax=Salininema proteolyticum TaxID=1607685 RepID=A0ABV8TX16_9ACTN
MNRGIKVASTAAATVAGTLALTAGTAMAAETPVEEHGPGLVKIKQDKVDIPNFCALQDVGAPVNPDCFSERFMGAEMEKRYTAAENATPKTGGMSLVNVDARDFSKVQVCGVAIMGSPETPQDCDNSIPPREDPVGPEDNEIALAKVDLTGAFAWNVCGVTAFQAGDPTTCKN